MKDIRLWWGGEAGKKMGVDQMVIFWVLGAGSRERTE